MGSRKQIKADKTKEEKKSFYYAVLKNCPPSPQKMRMAAELIRGKKVDKALQILKYSPKEASNRLEKLLLSAISNWQVKNEGVRIEDNNLYITRIDVAGGRQLKRIRPAPQGRAHRIRKRSNHVTLAIDNLKTKKETASKVKITDINQEK